MPSERRDPILSYELISFIGGVCGYYFLNGKIGAFGGMIGAPIGLLLVRKVIRPLMNRMDRVMGIKR